MRWPVIISAVIIAIMSGLYIEAGRWHRAYLDSLNQPNYTLIMETNRMRVYAVIDDMSKPLKVVKIE